MTQIIINTKHTTAVSLATEQIDNVHFFIKCAGFVGW